MSDALAAQSAAATASIVLNCFVIASLVSGLLLQVLGEEPMDFGKLC